MKKLCFLLILALLLGLGASSFADNGLEIIVMDGIPVVVESFDSSMSDTESVAAASVDAADAAGFKLPAGLVTIGDGAFEGISAKRVEITENVVSIGARAFADCQHLRELVIPATVESIDDTALEGCKNVTIYGEKNSEAERFASDNGIMFASWEEEIAPHEWIHASAPVVMPYVAF